MVKFGTKYFVSHVCILIQEKQDTPNSLGTFSLMSDSTTTQSPIKMGSLDEDDSDDDDAPIAQDKSKDPLKDVAKKRTIELTLEQKTRLPGSRSGYCLHCNWKGL